MNLTATLFNVLYPRTHRGVESPELEYATQIKVSPVRAGNESLEKPYCFEKGKVGAEKNLVPLLQIEIEGRGIIVSFNELKKALQEFDKMHSTFPYLEQAPKAVSDAGQEASKGSTRTGGKKPKPKHMGFGGGDVAEDEHKKEDN